jgi:hypothetical protein
MLKWGLGYFCISAFYERGIGYGNYYCGWGPVKRLDYPAFPGAYVFDGTRTYGARNSMMTVKEVVRVLAVVRDRSGSEVCVLRFGSGRAEPVTQYQGDWYYLGDLIDDLTRRR